MKKLLAAIIVLAVVAICARATLAPALADEGGRETGRDIVRETRAIDANVSRVHLDSMVHLVLHQGAAPSLVLSGEKRDVARITTVQQGDTLTIGTQDNVHTGHHAELRADLTVPNLQEFTSKGVGASDISGFSGERVTLAQSGAGAVTFTGQYRDVDARLAGVGSMTLAPGHADSIALQLGGAGEIKVSGQARSLRANLGGVGSLDAQQLQAENVELNMSGLGGASVYASRAANIKLSGMGSATVYGKPSSRTATTSGFGKVSWE